MKPYVPCAISARCNYTMRAFGLICRVAAYTEVCVHFTCPSLISARESRDGRANNACRGPLQENYLAHSALHHSIACS